MKTSGSRRRLIQNILLILLPLLIAGSLLYSNRPGHRKKEPDPDRTPPVIHLTRDERYFVMPGEMYEEEGYAAYDDRDGDLTAEVEVSVNGEYVRYRVRDEAGNITVRFRKIPRAGAADE